MSREAPTNPAVASLAASTRPTARDLAQGEPSFDPARAPEPRRAWDPKSELPALFAALESFAQARGVSFYEALAAKAFANPTLMRTVVDKLFPVQLLATATDTPAESDLGTQIETLTNLRRKIHDDLERLEESQSGLSRSADPDRELVHLGGGLVDSERVPATNGVGGLDR